MRKFVMSIIGVALLFAGVLHAQTAGAAPAPPADTAHAPDLVGNWQGTLHANKDLRTIVRISKADGKLKAVFYSIDQSPRPVDVTSISLQGSAVTFEIKPFELVYTGVLSPDGKSIIGKSAQGGGSLELDLQKVTDEAMWPIPEAPKPMPADAKPGLRRPHRQAQQPRSAGQALQHARPSYHYDQHHGE